MKVVNPLDSQSVNGLRSIVVDMCKACSKLPAACSITSPEVAENIHTKVFFLGLRTGTLEIVWGSLQWDDLIDCELRCRHCGQKFQFTCETYHGSGGAWRWL